MTVNFRENLKIVRPYSQPFPAQKKKVRPYNTRPYNTLVGPYNQPPLYIDSITFNLLDFDFKILSDKENSETRRLIGDLKAEMSRDFQILLTSTQNSPDSVSILDGILSFY